MCKSGLSEFQLYGRIRVLDSVKCPVFYQLQGFLGHWDAMSLEHTWHVLNLIFYVPFSIIQGIKCAHWVL